MEVARICEDLLGDADRAEKVYRRVLAIDRDRSDAGDPGGAGARPHLRARRSSTRRSRACSRIEVRLEENVETRRVALRAHRRRSTRRCWTTRPRRSRPGRRGSATTAPTWRRSRRSSGSTSGRRSGASSSPCSGRASSRRPSRSERRRAMTKAAETLAQQARRRARGDQRVARGARRVRPRAPDARGARGALREGRALGRPRRDAGGGPVARGGDAPPGSICWRGSATCGGCTSTTAGRARGVPPGALARSVERALPRGARGDARAATDARRDAAETLDPLYEADGDAERLLRVLEIEVETDGASRASGSPPCRRRSAPPRARSATRRGRSATRSAACGRRRASPRSTTWIDTVERLGEATGRWAEVCELYQRIAPDILDGDVQQNVRLRVGELARHKLDDRELAVEQYKKALEARGRRPARDDRARGALRRGARRRAPARDPEAPRRERRDRRREEGAALPDRRAAAGPARGPGAARSRPTRRSSTSRSTRTRSRRSRPLPRGGALAGPHPALRAAARRAASATLAELHVKIALVAHRHTEDAAARVRRARRGARSSIRRTRARSR